MLKHTGQRQNTCKQLPAQQLTELQSCGVGRAANRWVIFGNDVNMSLKLLGKKREDESHLTGYTKYTIYDRK